MKIGFAKVCITPPIGSSLVGYFVDRRSEGIMDELYANSVVIDDGKNLFTLVSCDLIWIEQETVKKVKEIVSKELKIKQENIAIHATHTHTGPLTAHPEGSIYTRNFYVDDSYLKILPLFIAGSIKIAYKNLKEVEIGIGKSRVEGIAFNRRYLMKDGRVITNPFNQKENIVKSVGEVDDTLYLVVFRSNREYIGFILNFALHPDTIGGNLISADWPGALRKKIEDEFKCNALILNGPSGDVNHINPEDQTTRTDKIREIIAEKLFEGTKKILENMEFRKYHNIKLFFKNFTLNYYSYTKQDVKKAKKILTSKIPKDTLKYLIAISILNMEKQKEKKWRLYLNGFAINKELCILTLPGEIFTGIGEKIRKILSFENTIIVQNSNFHLGYIPTKEAFLQHKSNLKIEPNFDNVRLSEAIGINSSYETLPLACKVGEDSEDIILKTIRNLKKQLKFI
ncbi:MAG: neutral/alkaline non-lysosomal ceramidase N-terminal domain-containing protein [Candidatus Omnitrophica bacterium]|nr:neutral/alkaline non-lysosomal ceramidase N-terminal domain-containing protein [Candidatus Omnitrophota bacterium]MCM8803116.1 neutral/alkaline non-lysosomal ceramidase N-terminal domain-containing protein [Candidatus Omnitrophota bacterium]